MIPGSDGKYFFYRYREHGVPMNRREWSYIDDLIPQRMMKNLRPWVQKIEPFKNSNSTKSAGAEISDVQDEREEELKIQQNEILDKKERDILEAHKIK